MTQMDSIGEVKTNISIKETEKKAEKLMYKGL